MIEQTWTPGQTDKNMKYLGIEIGGTKLQFGIGSGKGGEMTPVSRTVRMLKVVEKGNVS